MPADPAPADADTLAAAIARGREQLLTLAEVLPCAHSLAYAPGGLRYDQVPAAAASSQPPAAGDRAWAARYRRACAVIVDAHTAVGRALTRDGQPHLPSAAPTERTPRPEQMVMLAIEARLALIVIGHLHHCPAGLNTAARRYVTDALRSIGRAAELLPDTRNPAQPRICAIPDCGRLLDRRRGSTCQTHANKASRRRRRKRQ